jgi:hypothetical protein
MSKPENTRATLVLVLVLAIVLAIPGMFLFGPLVGVGVTALAALYLLWHVADTVEDLRDEVADLRRSLDPDRSTDARL